MDYCVRRRKSENMEILLLVELTIVKVYNFSNVKQFSNLSRNEVNNEKIVALSLLTVTFNLVCFFFFMKFILLIIFTFNKRRKNKT